VHVWEGCDDVPLVVYERVRVEEMFIGRRDLDARAQGMGIYERRKRLKGNDVFVATISILGQI